MACQEFEPLIIDYFDNALSARERREVELHLESCASCRAFWERQKEIDGTLASSVTAPLLSHGFKDRLLRRVDLQRAEGRTFRYLPDLMNLAAGLSVATVSGILLQYFISPLLEAPPSLALSNTAFVYSSLVISSLFFCGSLWYSLRREIRRWVTRHFY